MSTPDFKLSEARIAVVGLGLMGGSLALGLRGKCAALFGVDPQPAARELALSARVVDRADSLPANLLPQADLVVLAAPVPAILSLLEDLPALMPNPCILMDLGSTKQDIVNAMSRLPGRFDPIGGHPLCGREKLSLVNAEANLYRDALFLLTSLPRSSPRALSAARQVVEALGAHADILAADEHDRRLAAASHLPFLLSSALALSVPQDAAPFVGPGFRSTVRLAETPSSMMLGVLQTNRRNILAAVSKFQSQLAEMKAALTAEDYPALESILNESRRLAEERAAPSLSARPPGQGRGSAAIRV